MAKKFISDIAFSESVKKQQEKMGSRAIYQKMAEKRDWQQKLTMIMPFIRDRDSFYMASVNADGQPYIQHRGGPKGFLKIIDDHHLGFADYSGNRQYISVGNFDDNNKVHLFLMDYPNRTRIKIWGEAMVIDKNDPELQFLYDEKYGSQLERFIKIKVTAWDANCPQHIQQRYTLEEMKPHINTLNQKIQDLEKKVEDCCPKENQL
ncbi:pyridoxamine 5'-phosphate oxidase family protein [Aquimarina spongiae]|uniref:Pyridoxamine 5'-phosphate oxidase N-terminal domain-containing protein n=1 Tax=Aquimarina spongiae TaxID=570521 RepID=A0A1M6J1U5_9FLAO|nr:pyridoxamine 5'-phosphate oxidase family protein [Aquimarina spongiae]SHJ40619.1 hypothetical protein SAMN04488508_108194 [Aquimarina spongiae]